VHIKKKDYRKQNMVGMAKRQKEPGKRLPTEAKNCYRAEGINYEPRHRLCWFYWIKDY
jgi:hypothetical protein